MPSARAAASAIEGDLFIDCSGHAALLIGKHFGVEWIDRGDVLANDRALAVQVPVARMIADRIADHRHRARSRLAVGHRLAGAARHRLRLFLALPRRRRAHEILRDYVARTAGEAAAEALTPRELSVPTGHRAEFWRGNCLAIGLSAGFIEPLEASAIVMIELSLNALVDNFPASAEAMPIHAERFNALFRTRWDRVVEFLKLHYVLSRRDEPYWRAQRDPDTFRRASPISCGYGATSRRRPTTCRSPMRSSPRLATNMSITGWAAPFPPNCRR